MRWADRVLAASKRKKSGPQLSQQDGNIPQTNGQENRRASSCSWPQHSLSALNGVTSETDRQVPTLQLHIHILCLSVLQWKTEKLIIIMI